MGRSAVRTDVGELGTGETVRIGGNVRSVDGTALAPKEGAVVTGGCSHLGTVHVGSLGGREELLDEVAACAVATPGLGSSGRDVGIGRRSDQEQGGTPARGGETVLKDRENGLLGCGALAVVGHEEHLVCAVLTGTGGIQGVRRIHDLLCIGRGISPTGRSGVDLGIEIQTGEQEPCGSLVHAAIIGIGRGLGLGLGKRRLDLEQLALDELEHLCAAILLSLLGGDGGHERDIAEGIHRQIVMKGTEETDLGRHSRIVLGSDIEIMVAVGDTGIESIVVTAKHGVAGIP